MLCLYALGYTQKEIAEFMDMSVKAVRKEFAGMRTQQMARNDVHLLTLMITDKQITARSIELVQRLIECGQPIAYGTLVEIGSMQRRNDFSEVIGSEQHKPTNP